MTYRSQVLARGDEDRMSATSANGTNPPSGAKRKTWARTEHFALLTLSGRAPSGDIVHGPWLAIAAHLYVCFCFARSLRMVASGLSVGASTSFKVFVS